MGFSIGNKVQGDRALCDERGKIQIKTLPDETQLEAKVTQKRQPQKRKGGASFEVPPLAVRIFEGPCRHEPQQCSPGPFWSRKQACVPSLPRLHSRCKSFLRPLRSAVAVVPEGRRTISSWKIALPLLRTIAPDISICLPHVCSIFCGNTGAYCGYLSAVRCP